MIILVRARNSFGAKYIILRFHSPSSKLISNQSFTTQTGLLAPSTGQNHAQPSTPSCISPLISSTPKHGHLAFRRSVRIIIATTRSGVSFIASGKVAPGNDEMRLVRLHSRSGYSVSSATRPDYRRWSEIYGYTHGLGWGCDTWKFWGFLLSFAPMRLSLSPKQHSPVSDEYFHQRWPDRPIEGMVCLTRL